MANVLTPHVLMIGPSLESRGGMATVEKQLIERLIGAGVQVRLISTYDDCGRIKKAAIALAAYMRYCRALKDVDLVHAHMAARGSYERKSIFLRRAQIEGKKTLIHLHGAEFDLWFDNALTEKKRDEVRGLFDASDAVIALSEEWERWLVSRGFAPKRLVVLHNAVPVPVQSCSPCLQQNVLFLGRLAERKSPDVLLRAAREMLGKYAGTKLVFGGDGCPERYEKLAQELGIADRCEFLGWIAEADRERLFDHAGIYCLPSKNEGMPMSVLEAMGHGIPTIATPVGGVPQLIKDGVNGFLMPVGDEKKLSDLLCKLMGDPSLRKQIGAAGRRTISSDFNIEHNVEELIRLYEGLMV